MEEECFAQLKIAIGVNFSDLKSVYQALPIECFLEIAKKLPTNKAELLEIDQMTPFRFERFGSHLLKVCKDFNTKRKNYLEDKQLAEMMAKAEEANDFNTPSSNNNVDKDCLEVLNPLPENNSLHYEEFKFLGKKKYAVSNFEIVTNDFFNQLEVLNSSTEENISAKNPSVSPVPAIRVNYLKRKLKEYHNGGNKKRRGNNPLVFDDLFLRFPTISNKINKMLDDKSVVNLKTASRNICSFLEDNRLFCIRKIKIYIKKNHAFYDSWRKVVRKTPAAIITEIANSIKEFFVYFTKSCRTQLCPLHIAAFLGNLKLVKHIVERTKDYCPKNKHGWTPLHFAVLQCQLKIKHPE